MTSSFRTLSPMARIALLLSVGMAMAMIGWRLATIWAAPFHSAIRGWDDTGYYLWLRSAVNDGDLDFRNDLEQTRTLRDEERARWLALPPTPAGRSADKYSIGWALSAAPFYLLAKGLLRLGAFVGIPVDAADPDHALCQLFIILGQAAYAFAGLWMVWRLLQRWFSAEDSLWSVMLIWLNSPLVLYWTYKLTLSHGVTFFWIACSWLIAFQVRDGECRVGRWALLGFAVGMSFVCRPPAILYGLFPLVVVATRLAATPRQLAGSTALFILAFAAPVIVQLAAWKIVFGSYFTYSYGDEGFTWASPHLWDVLFSPLHGLFYWHPLLLAGAGGFLAFMGARAQERPPRVWLVSLLLTWYVNAAWHNWWFGGSFGNRAFEAALIPMMAGLGFIFSRLKPGPRKIVVPIFLLCGMMNFQLAFLFTTKAIPSTLPVTWPELLRALWHPPFPP